MPSNKWITISILLAGVVANVGFVFWVVFIKGLPWPLLIPFVGLAGLLVFMIVDTARRRLR